MGAVAAGSAIQGVASIYGAYEQQKAQSQARQDANNRYNTMQHYVNGQLQTGPNQYSGNIMQFLSGSNPAMLGQAGQIDLSGLGSNQAFNAGQDGLMQSMNRSLNYQSDPSMNAGIQQMASGNSQFDNTGLFQNLKAVQNQNDARQVAQLQGGYTSIGSRLGSGALNAEANMRSTLANNDNLQNSQIASQSYENAQNRAMSALGLGSQNNQFMNQYGLNAYQAQGNMAQQLASLGLQQMGMGLQGQQYNVGQQNQFAQSNQNSQNLWNQMYLSGIGQAAGIQQGQNAGNAQLLSLLNGQAMPPSQPGQYGAAFGDIGSLMMLYPFMQQMMQGGGGSGGGNNNYFPQPSGGNYGIPQNINWGFGN